MSDTATFTATIEGDKLYQQRAREALPLLVRQAEARSKITYEDLATELGMPNPRNLNFPLGAIVNSLKELEQAWGSRIPPITCVVVNKSTRLLGPGISGSFGIPVNFAALSRARREEIVDAKVQDIYTYTRWPDVLKALAFPTFNRTLPSSIGRLPGFAAARPGAVPGRLPLRHRQEVPRDSRRLPLRSAEDRQERGLLPPEQPPESGPYLSKAESCVQRASK